MDRNTLKAKKLSLPGLILFTSVFLVFITGEMSSAFGRPSGLNWSYPTPEGNFRIHYTEDASSPHKVPDSDGKKETLPSYVEKVGKYFEESLAYLTTTMGYPKPPPDGTEGGDALFDVYIMQMSDPAETQRSGAISYINMRNDLDWAGGKMQVNAAHELHHAIQNIYTADLREGLAELGGYGWFEEATSVWIEDQVYDQFNSNNRRNAKDFLKTPDESLDEVGGGYPAWIFNEYIETRLDPHWIKLFWERIKNGGYSKDDLKLALNAIDYVLRYNGFSFEDEFDYFCAKNYAQEGFYKDAAYWKIDNGENVKIENSSSPHKLDYSTEASRKVTEQTTRLYSMSSRYFKFVPGDTLTKPTGLTIKVKGGYPDTIGAYAIAKKSDGTYDEYKFTIDPDTKEGEIGVGLFGKNTMKEVVLVLVNHHKSEDANDVKYEAALRKCVVFVVDSTGSMWDEIDAAKGACKKIINKNVAENREVFYVIWTFKDGSPSLQGETSDPEKAKSLISSLSASGGGWCPESSLTAVRKAAKHSPNSEIHLMTDAPSNSFGQDGTHADSGELTLTIWEVKENNCRRVNTLIYKTGCELEEDSFYSWGDNYNQTCSAVTALANDPSGTAGYSMLSEQTGGLYFWLSTEDTEDAVEIVLRESSVDSSILSIDDSLSSGSGANSHQIPVDSSVNTLQITLNADSDASLTLAVKDPYGATVADTDAGVTYITVAGSTFYGIEVPTLTEGNWTAHVSGTGAYRLSVTASTDKPMSYTGDLSTGAGRSLQLGATFEAEVSGLYFELVNLDGSPFKSVNLSSSDGLNYSGSVTIDEIGSYRFKATDEINYQRMDARKITVGSVTVEASDDEVVLPGQSVTHAFTITNLGAEEASYDLYTNSTADWADSTGVPSSLTIISGGQEIIEIPVNVPSDAEVGSVDKLSVQVIDQENALLNDTDEAQTIVALLYDFNENGIVDEDDILLVAERWNTAEGDEYYNADYDINEDGVINIIDVMKVAAQYGFTDSILEERIFEAL